MAPDGRRVAFVVPELREGVFGTRTFIADLLLRSVTPLPSQGLDGTDQFSPVWLPDSSTVTIGLLPVEGQPAGAVIAALGEGQPSQLPPPEKGFDFPRGWSADGKYLAVRSFSGTSVANPGFSQLVMVSPASGSRFVVASGEVEVIAWVKQ